MKEKEFSLDEMSLNMSAIERGGTTKISYGAIEGKHIKPGTLDISHLSDNTINSFGKKEEVSLLSNLISSMSPLVNSLQSNFSNLQKDIINNTNSINGIVNGTSPLPINYISTNNLKDLSVTSAKLVNNSVGTTKLADVSVTNPKLGLLSVGTANMQDFAITNIKLSNDSVTPEKLNLLTQSAFKAYKNATQTINSYAWTKVSFNQVNTDNQLEYDITTSRFIPKKSGMYLVGAYITWGSYPDGTGIRVAIYKNGNYYLDIGNLSTSSKFSGSNGLLQNGVTGMNLLYGDYVEIYAYTTSSVAIQPGESGTYFSGIKLL